MKSQFHRQPRRHEPVCGICGIAHVDPARPVDSKQLATMRDTLAHRGPDGAGMWIGDGVGFGHRRLSIIDVAGGAQPLANEDESIWLTFNGEVYNYRELTARLVRAGHRFRTHSDSEVLVHAYEEYGPDFVTRLNGMFAFGLYDCRRHRLLLGRDHFGVKPMFYALTGDALLFGSEIKAIRALLPQPRATSVPALQEYLLFRAPTWDRTIWDGIRRLPPAHVAVWEDGRLTLHRYWRPPVTQVAKISLSDAVVELDTLLERAVQGQMISEVPLGAFCSGGVDSGLVSAFAARHSPHRLETFSVAFEDPAWDESGLVKDTVMRLGTEHHSVTMRADALLALLPRLTQVNDEPLSQPNSVPLYVLSQLARQYVTVALTGEGADEIFCGYPRFHIPGVRAFLEGLPDSILRTLSRAGLAASDHRLRTLGRMLPRTLEDVLLFNSACVDPELIVRLTGEPLDAAVAHRRQLLSECLDPADPVASISRFDTLTYLPGLLERMDRMAMAHGLEGRVPFLDVPMAEWGLRLPSNLRAPLGRNKPVVKGLAEHFLSRSITRGRKSGFGLPLGTWFRSPALAPLVTRLQEPAFMYASGVRKPVLLEVIARHRSGAADHGDLLWLLSCYLLWLEATGALGHETHESADALTG